MGFILDAIGITITPDTRNLELTYQVCAVYKYPIIVFSRLFSRSTTRGTVYIQIAIWQENVKDFGSR